MSSSGIRDLGEILLKVATTFLGGFLLALALGVDNDSIKTWVWVVALTGCPLAYGVRAWGLREMEIDEEHDRRLAERG
jgi:hypothetical protein